MAAGGGGGRRLAGEAVEASVPGASAGGGFGGSGATAGGRCQAGRRKGRRDWADEEAREALRRAACDGGGRPSPRRGTAAPFRPAANRAANGPAAPAPLV